MDAKERLRLYLEHRRDTGETELVLDSMSVEDVLRVLGAGAGGRQVESGRAALSPGTENALALPVERNPSASSDATRGSGSAGQSGDWREALRGADAAPSGTPRRSSVPASAARTSQPESLVRTDTERAPAPPLPAPSPPAALQAPVTSKDEKGTPLTVALELVPNGLVIGSAAQELFGGPQSPLASLEAVAAAAQACTLCALHKSAKHVVPGEGNPSADFVCVGEAPGANEDEQGRPFVGVSGQLLTKILAAIDLARDDVFICNVLKHRPPGNRNPLPEEVAACSPFLVRQIELIKPKVIVAFGTFAAQTLLQSKEPLGKLRGMIHRYYGVPLIVTYHPAALLRNPSWKRPTWEDVQLARRILDRANGA